MLASFLQKQLEGVFADYVQDMQLDHDALNSGDVVLKNFDIKPEALGKNLPVVVRVAHVGLLDLRIPYAHLSTRPVTLTIKDVTILASPREAADFDEDEAKEALVLMKRGLVESLEAPFTAHANRSVTEMAIESAVWRVLRNVKIDIQNVHVRLDQVPGLSAVGLRLGSLQVDASTRSKLVSGFDKAIRMQQLCIYADPPSKDSLNGANRGEESAARHVKKEAGYVPVLGGMWQEKAEKKIFESYSEQCECKGQSTVGRMPVLRWWESVGYHSSLREQQGGLHHYILAPMFATGSLSMGKAREVVCQLTCSPLAIAADLQQLRLLGSIEQAIDTHHAWTEKVWEVERKELSEGEGASKLQRALHKSLCAKTFGAEKEPTAEQLLEIQKVEDMLTVHHALELRGKSREHRKQHAPCTASWVLLTVQLTVHELAVSLLRSTPSPPRADTAEQTTTEELAMELTRLSLVGVEAASTIQLGPRILDLQVQSTSVHLAVSEIVLFDLFTGGTFQRALSSTQQLCSPDSHALSFSHYQSTRAAPQLLHPLSTTSIIRRDFTQDTSRASTLSISIRLAGRDHSVPVSMDTMEIMLTLQPIEVVAAPQYLHGILRFFTAVTTTGGLGKDGLIGGLEKDGLIGGLEKDVRKGHRQSTKEHELFGRTAKRQEHERTNQHSSKKKAKKKKGKRQKGGEATGKDLSVPAKWNDIEAMLGGQGTDVTIMLPISTEAYPTRPDVDGAVNGAAGSVVGGTGARSRCDSWNASLDAAEAEVVVKAREVEAAANEAVCDAFRRAQVALLRAYDEPPPAPQMIRIKAQLDLPVVLLLPDEGSHVLAVDLGHLDVQKDCAEKEMRVETERNKLGWCTLYTIPPSRNFQMLLEEPPVRKGGVVGGVRFFEDTRICLHGAQAMVVPSAYTPRPSILHMKTQLLHPVAVEGVYKQIYPHIYPHQDCNAHDKSACFVPLPAESIEEHAQVATDHILVDLVAQEIHVVCGVSKALMPLLNMLEHGPHDTTSFADWFGAAGWTTQTRPEQAGTSERTGTAAVHAWVLKHKAEMKMLRGKSKSLVFPVGMSRSETIIAHFNAWLKGRPLAQAEKGGMMSVRMMTDYLEEIFEEDAHDESTERDSGLLDVVHAVDASMGKLLVDGQLPITVAASLVPALVRKISQYCPMSEYMHTTVRKHSLVKRTSLHRRSSSSDLMKQSESNVLLNTYQHLAEYATESPNARGAKDLADAGLQVLQLAGVSVRIYEETHDRIASIMQLHQHSLLLTVMLRDVHISHSGGDPACFSLAVNNITVEEFWNHLSAGGRITLGREKGAQRRASNKKVIYTPGLCSALRVEYRVQRGKKDVYTDELHGIEIMISKVHMFLETRALCRALELLVPPLNALAATFDDEDAGVAPPRIPMRVPVERVELLFTLKELQLCMPQYADSGAQDSALVVACALTGCYVLNAPESESMVLNLTPQICLAPILRDDGTGIGFGVVAHTLLAPTQITCSYEHASVRSDRHSSTACPGKSKEQWQVELDKISTTSIVINAKPMRFQLPLISLEILGELMDQLAAHSAQLTDITEAMLAELAVVKELLKDAEDTASEHFNGGSLFGTSARHLLLFCLLFDGAGLYPTGAKDTEELLVLPHPSMSLHSGPIQLYVHGDKQAGSAPTELCKIALQISGLNVHLGASDVADTVDALSGKNKLIALLTGATKHLGGVCAARGEFVVEAHFLKSHKPTMVWEPVVEPFRVELAGKINRSGPIDLQIYASNRININLDDHMFKYISCLPAIVGDAESENVAAAHTRHTIDEMLKAHETHLSTLWSARGKMHQTCHWVVNKTGLAMSAPLVKHQGMDPTRHFVLAGMLGHETMAVIDGVYETKKSENAVPEVPWVARASAADERDAASSGPRHHEHRYLELGFNYVGTAQSLLNRHEIHAPIDRVGTYALADKNTTDMGLQCVRQCVIAEVAAFSTEQVTHKILHLRSAVQILNATSTKLELSVCREAEPGRHYSLNDPALLQPLTPASTPRGGQTHTLKKHKPSVFSLRSPTTKASRMREGHRHEEEKKQQQTDSLFSPIESASSLSSRDTVVIPVPLLALGQNKEWVLCVRLAQELDTSWKALCSIMDLLDKECCIMREGYVVRVTQHPLHLFGSPSPGKQHEIVASISPSLVVQNVLPHPMVLRVLMSTPTETQGKGGKTNPTTSTPPEVHVEATMVPGETVDIFYPVSEIMSNPNCALELTALPHLYSPAKLSIHQAQTKPKSKTKSVRSHLSKKPSSDFETGEDGYVEPQQPSTSTIMIKHRSLSPEIRNMTVMAEQQWGGWRQNDCTGGDCFLAVYAPCWVVNRTDLTLQYVPGTASLRKKTMQLGAIATKAAGQAGLSATKATGKVAYKSAGAAVQASKGFRTSRSSENEGAKDALSRASSANITPSRSNSRRGSKSMLPRGKSVASMVLRTGREPWEQPALLYEPYVPVSKLMCVYAKDSKLKVAAKTQGRVSSFSKSFNTDTAGASGLIELTFGDTAKDAADADAEANVKKSSRLWKAKSGRRLAAAVHRRSAPAVQLAVKMQSATGIFWRTTEVLFSPKYVLLNRLGTNHGDNEKADEYIGGLQVKAVGMAGNTGMVTIEAPDDGLAAEEQQSSRSSFNFHSNKKHHLMVRLPEQGEGAVMTAEDEEGVQSEGAVPDELVRRSKKEKDWSGGFDIDSIGSHVVRLKNGHLLYVEVRSEAFLHRHDSNLGDDTSAGTAGSEQPNSPTRVQGVSKAASASGTTRQSPGTIVVVFHACISPDTTIAVPGVLGFRVINNTLHEFTVQEMRGDFHREDGFTVGAKQQMMWGWTDPSDTNSTFKVFHGGQYAQYAQYTDADPDVALICPIRKVGQFCRLSDGSDVTSWSDKLGIAINISAHVTVEDHQYVLTLEETQSGTCTFHVRVNILEARLSEVYSTLPSHHDKMWIRKRSQEKGGGTSGEPVLGSPRQLVNPHIEAQFGEANVKSTRAIKATRRPCWQEEIRFQETHKLSADMPSPPSEIGLRCMSNEWMSDAGVGFSVGRAADTDHEIGSVRLSLDHLWLQSLIAAERSPKNIGKSLHLPVWYPLIKTSHEEGSQVVGRVLVGVECKCEGKGAHEHEMPDLELAARSLIEKPFEMDWRTRISSLGLSVSGPVIGAKDHEQRQEVMYASLQRIDLRVEMKDHPCVLHDWQGVSLDVGNFQVDSMLPTRTRDGFEVVVSRATNVGTVSNGNYYREGGSEKGRWLVHEDIGAPNLIFGGAAIAMREKRLRLRERKAHRSVGATATLKITTTTTPPSPSLCTLPLHRSLLPTGSKPAPAYRQCAAKHTSECHR
jgi:hypothetical protein